jgi:hypothetical protein
LKEGRDLLSESLDERESKKLLSQVDQLTKSYN